jgi:hypothetical protein
MIQAKFGLNWPSGFRGEDFWKSLQTDDKCSVCNVKFENISIALNIQILSIKSASVAITKIFVVSK